MENSPSFIDNYGTAFPPKVSNLPSKLPRPEWHRQLAEESMFNNLIESTSHANEFKRRGSFLLFTTATYLILFVVTGVVSIYAYDAHLERQNTELELLTFVPVPQPDPPPEVLRNTIQPTSDIDKNITRSTRAGELIDSASNPNNVPDKVGTVAPSVPPARPDSVHDAVNADPV